MQARRAEAWTSGDSPFKREVFVRNAFQLRHARYIILTKDFHAGFHKPAT